MSSAAHTTSDPHPSNCFSQNEAGLSHQNGLVLAAAGRGASPLQTHRGSCKVPTSDLASTAAGRGKRVLSFSVLPITAAEPLYAHKRAARFHLVRRACRHTQHSSAFRWRSRCPLPQPAGPSRCRRDSPRFALFSSSELQLRLFPHGRRQSHGSAPPAISQPKPLFPRRPTPALRSPVQPAPATFRGDRPDRAAALRTGGSSPSPGEQTANWRERNLPPPRGRPGLPARSCSRQPLAEPRQGAGPEGPHRPVRRLGGPGRGRWPSLTCPRWP